jgi:hypothetical protein
VTAPVINYEARLQPIGWHLHDRPAPGSWFITHGLGEPAAGTYTEVAFAPGVLERVVLVGEQAYAVGKRLLEEVVRQVAVALYGTAWAFTYRPDQYEDAIARHGLRRRERVIVTSIEVWA